MRTVVSTGVLADKIAALTLQVQTAPLHTPSAFDSLMTMVKKKGRRETLVAMDALRQLYLQEMLPEKRKLRKFSEVKNFLSLLSIFVVFVSIISLPLQH